MNYNLKNGGLYVLNNETYFQWYYEEDKQQLCYIAENSLLYNNSMVINQKDFLLFLSKNPVKGKLFDFDYVFLFKNKIIVWKQYITHFKMDWKLLT